jgi:hypothetical protein
VVDWTAVATNAVLDSENAQAASGAGSDEVKNVIIDTGDADQAASGAGSDEAEAVISDTDGAEKAAAAGHGAESDVSTGITSDFDSDGSGPNKARRSAARNESGSTSPLSTTPIAWVAHGYGLEVLGPHVRRQEVDKRCLENIFLRQLALVAEDEEREVVHFEVVHPHVV